MKHRCSSPCDMGYISGTAIRRGRIFRWGREGGAEGSGYLSLSDTCRVTHGMVPVAVTVACAIVCFAGVGLPFLARWSDTIPVKDSWQVR